MTLGYPFSMMFGAGDHHFEVQFEDRFQNDLF